MNLDIAAAVLAAGMLACAGGAVAVHSQPLPADAGVRWEDIHRRWGAPIVGQTFALDSAGPAGKEAAVPPAVPRGEPFLIHGWAFDPAALQSADSVAVRVDHGPWTAATYRLKRQDVADRFDLPAVVECGFHARVATARLAPGAHDAELATVSQGRYTVLPSRVRFTVTAR